MFFFIKPISLRLRVKIKNCDVVQANVAAKTPLILVLQYCIMNFKYFKEAYGICPAVKPACSAGFNAGYACMKTFQKFN
jgi:hypothetical protein